MKYDEMKWRTEEIKRLREVIFNANAIKDFRTNYIVISREDPYGTMTIHNDGARPGLLAALRETLQSWASATIHDSELAIAELEKDTGEAEWVNVKDRLPEAGQAVWVMEDGPIEGRYKAGSFVTDAGFSRPDWWAPRFIPAPPKESGRV